MERKRPFFSVLVPSYNRPNELKRCIESIIVSKFEDYEIIVSDDNSPSAREISDVMEPFLQIGKVRFFFQTENLKEPGNKNFLVSKATGKFNIVLGDDDVLGPLTLKTLHSEIMKNPNYDIYGFGYFIVNEMNHPISRHAAPHFTLLNSPQRKSYFFDFGVSPMSFIHPATFCCKAGIELNVPYRDDVGIGEDLCFLLQVTARNYSIVAIPEPLFNWRKVRAGSSVRQGNQSAELLASVKAKSLIYQVLRHEEFNDLALSRYIQSPGYRSRFLYTEALSDIVASQLSGAELGMSANMAQEYDRLKESRIFRFRVKFRRVFAFFDLCRIVGVIAASKWLIDYLYFRVRHRNNA